MDFTMARRGIVVVCLGLFGYVLVTLSGKLAPRAENAKDRVAEAYQGFQEGKCKSCHPAIWREWEGSMHAKAWIDEIYQEMASQVSDREAKCDRCHAPQPILITGIGKMPELRNEHREAGVSCLVCHLDAKGAMHGPPASAETYFHANITDPIYTKPTTLCGTCHGQPTVPEHDQVSSFLNSKFAEDDKSCATCHMPIVNRLQSTASYESIKGRKHTWRGSRSVAQLRRAAALQLEITPEKVNVKLQSKTGHILPGGTLRTIMLEMVQLTSENGVRQKKRVSISAKEENRLLPDENRIYVFDTPSRVPGDTITVRLMYQLTPKTPESEWILMAEKNHVVP